MKLRWVCICIAILLPGLAGAATLNVPSVAYPTIQAGIDAAAAGDTVLVADGVYTGDGNRDIDLRGKDIVLKSENGPELTIIDCQASETDLHQGFDIHSGETPACRIEGFTLTNGLYAWHIYGGGAAQIREASPTFTNCIFRNNSSPYGGAVLVQNSTTTFTNCRFVDNTSPAGGAVHIRQTAAPVFDSCVFVGNEAVEGGAIFLTNLSQVSLSQCSLLGNLADSGGSAIFIEPSTWGAELANCIVAFGYATSPIEGGPVELSCCNVWGNPSDWAGSIEDQADQNGNFSANPLICAWLDGSYSLEPESPCLPGNNDCGQLIGALDYECTWEPRSWQVNAEGTGDAPTIQAAVGLAGRGDTIFLASGTYRGEGNRDIDFGGKNLVLRSVAGSDYTIIDCEGSPEEPHRGIILGSGEDERSLIAGVTIMNGLAPRDGRTARGAAGGAILMQGASTRFIDCKFRYNKAMSGAGVYIEGGDKTTFDNCSFQGNQALLEKHIWEGSGSSSVPSNHPLKVEAFREAVEDRDRRAERDTSGSVLGDARILDYRHPGSESDDFSLQLPARATRRGNHGELLKLETGKADADGAALSGESREYDLESVLEPYGGGIYVRNAAISTNNCTFEGNYSWWGGGLSAIHAPVYATDCVFDSCSAGLRGGGLFAIGDSLTILDTRFQEDSALFGGGIYADSISVLYIERTDFVANVGASDYGGGLALNWSQGILRDNKIQDNYSSNGSAGLSIRGGALTVVDCLFERNITNTGNGAGCRVTDSAKTIFDRCVFAKNVTIHWFGGGMYIYESPVRLQNCTFSDNGFTNLYVLTSYPIPPIENCLFAFAPRGAGAYFPDTATTLVNCNIYGNVGGNWYDDIADQLGQNGNISENPDFCDRWTDDYSLLDISPCLPENNGTGAFIGALGVGCHFEPKSWFVKPNGTGDAATINAAVDLATFGDTIWLSDGVYTGEGNHDIIFYNKAITLLSMNGPEKTIIDCQGSTPEHLARGFYFGPGDDHRTQVTGVTIKGGYTMNGAGVFCDISSAPRFLDCVISHNSAWDYGGAAVVQASAARFENCIFENNLAANGGGFFFWHASDALLTNCTLVENRAHTGGGMLLYWSEPKVERTIIAFQTLGGSFKGYGCAWLPRISCSNIYDNFGDQAHGCLDSSMLLDGNFSEDPLFCDTATGNYGLLAESPCAPSNNSCGVLIGARGVGCDLTDNEEPDPVLALPTEYVLSQNYPNPFNPATAIDFALPQRSHVELVVYNILGQQVATLVNEDRPPGEYMVAWHGEDSHGRPVSTGMYFYRIKAGEFVETRKMLLLK